MTEYHSKMAEASWVTFTSQRGSKQALVYPEKHGGLAAYYCERPESNRFAYSIHLASGKQIATCDWEEHAQLICDAMNAIHEYTRAEDE